MRLQIREQELERAAMMIMCDNLSRDAVCAIQYGWRQDHKQGYTPSAAALSVRSARLAHEQGSSRCMSLEIISRRLD